MIVIILSLLAALASSALLVLLVVVLLRRTLQVRLAALGVALVVLAASIVVPVGRGAGTDRVLPVVLVVLALLVLVSSIVALIAKRPTPTGPLAEWANAHGVEVTPGNADFLAAYVHEGHRLRLICGLGALGVAPAISAATGFDAGSPGLTWVLVGYLVGCVWGAAWLTRLPAGTERRASLETRQLADYLAGRLRGAQLVLPLVALGLVVVTVLHDPSEGMLRQSGTPLVVSGDVVRTVVVLGLLVPAVMGIVWWLQRHIVAKPQPVTSSDLLAADDAVRSSSVHLLSGTGIGISLIFISGQLFGLATSVSDGVAAVCNVVAVVCFGAALVSWRYYGHRAWRVQRRTPDATRTSVASARGVS